MLWKNRKELLGQPNKNKGGLEQITYPFLASVSLSVNGNTDPYMGEARGGPDEARSGWHRTGAHRMGAQLDPGAPHPSGTPVLGVYHVSGMGFALRNSFLNEFTQE